MSLRYIVDIELQMSGDPASGAMGKVGAKGDELGKRLGKVGSAFADGFTGVVENIGSKLMSIGKMGVGAGIAAATYGVLGLNNELESTTVSLAAVLNAQGKAAGMADGMEQAAGWVKQIKKDAKDLPGEFSDLLGIVQSAAGAAFNAGLDVKGFESLASQSMAVGKAMAVPIDQAGRELAQLLEGRAGGHNVFGTRLGIHAEGFNEKTREERLKILTESLAKFQPAIKVFGDTFDAQSSTLIDNAKTFLGAATGPLFDRVKGAIADVNAWFEANEAKVSGWAKTVGDLLVTSFDKGKAIVLEYGPPLLGFLDRMREKFVEVWTSAEPYIEKIGGYIKGFLENPESIDKLITLGKLYAAVKIGGGISGFAGGAVPGSGLVGGAMQAGAFGYMGGAVLGAATGIEGLGTVGAGVGVGGAVGGPAGAALGGAIGFYVDQVLSLADEVDTHNQIQIQHYQHLLEYDKNTHDAHGRIDTSSKGFADAVEAVAAQASFLDQVFGDVATQMQIAALKINAAADKVSNDAKNKAWGEAQDAKINAALAASNASIEKDRAAKRADLDKKKKGAAGKGGVSIGSVNITVSSNQSPGQIARDVMKEATGMKRYRTSSPRVANYSAGR